MRTVVLPPVSITAPRFERPFPVTPNTPRERPMLPNIDIHRGQFSCLVTLYQIVQTLNEQIDSLESTINFIIDQLDADEQPILKNDLQALRQEVANAKNNADRKFNEQLSELKLWPFYNHPKYNLEIQKFDLIGVVLSTYDSNFYRQRWENEYGVARRAEITIKQKLVDFCSKILPQLNRDYLTKFYPNYALFPVRSQLGADKAITEIGARNFHDGFLDNKVEILISDVMLTRVGSQFGHVAINIGGIVYGRAPSAWDIRGKEKYLCDQQAERNTIGYVIQLSGVEKQKLFQSIINKIVKNEKYSLINHSCSGEVISSFGELGINIVDPRWTLGDTFSPADIDNFLKHSKRVIQINKYPERK